MVAFFFFVKFVEKYFRNSSEMENLRESKASAENSTK